MLALTLRYTAVREQFGRPIGRFQAVQQLVAELAGEVAAMEIGADSALLALESGASNAWLAVASAKIDAERQHRAADRDRASGPRRHRCDARARAASIDPATLVMARGGRRRVVLGGRHRRSRAC